MWLTAQMQGGKKIKGRLARRRETESERVKQRLDLEVRKKVKRRMRELRPPIEKLTGRLATGKARVGC